MTETIQYAVDGDGIATLTIDLPGTSMNVLNEQMMTELKELVGKVAGDPAVKGAIITSGKPAFLAGADLKMLEKLAMTARTAGAAETFKASHAINLLLRSIETSGKPFVAAINGLAMGGGLELSLACHYRVVADDPKIQLSQPEVKVGLMPGGGGTQRLPRLMGIQASAPYLLQGKSLSPQEALGFGVVNEVVPLDQLLPAAKKWLMEKGDPVAAWDKKGFKVPGGAGAMDPRSVQVFIAGAAMVQKETLRNYPAALAILSAVYEGTQIPMDQALKVESRYFASLLLEPTAGNMIRTLFINKGAADKLVRRPKEVEKTKVAKLGVLGAGMMGAGIAYVSAQAGMEVVLIDREQAYAEKGKAYSEGLVKKAVQRRRMIQEKADALLARITPTTDFSMLAGCDLVIEAVFEDIKVKAETTKKAEAVIPKTAVFGSNTSTLPITGLAKASARPANFIGIHFFSPVDKMPLVEIIMGKKTSPETLARALDYAAQIRKTPVVVNDSRGFYTSRVVTTFVNEGMLMLTEGIKPALIENGGRMAGMPVGPLSLADEVSIELSYHIKEATKLALAGKHIPDATEPLIDHMFLELKRLGKKNGKGFYDYPEGGKKHLWPGLAEICPPAAEQPDVSEVKKRILYRQALETVRCMEEGVVMHPEDADVGAIFGWGFAPFTGGPISMIDTIGVETFVAGCKALAKKYGIRFKPPKTLRDMAAKGETFYKEAA
jgi:3-hydroxyacyl-CoA dehydrogenase/enoyl-CoA hydratase/3-hydroxybutyryl-CoA epimerase